MAESVAVYYSLSSFSFLVRPLSTCFTVSNVSCGGNKRGRGGGEEGGLDEKVVVAVSELRTEENTNPNRSN